MIDHLRELLPCWKAHFEAARDAYWHFPHVDGSFSTRYNPKLATYGLMSLSQCAVGALERAIAAPGNASLREAAFDYIRRAQMTEKEIQWIREELDPRVSDGGKYAEYVLAVRVQRLRDLFCEKDVPVLTPAMLHADWFAANGGQA